LVYNLEEILRALYDEYFDVPVFLPITWFGSGNIPRTSILFGSYSCQTSLIKVNRVLDSEEFPLFVIRYIVYHEMLHHLLPPKKGKRGRWDIHHAAFKAREWEFKEYKEAQKFMKHWKKKHLLGRLLSASIS
jgi:hypothetical protein